MKYKSEAIFGSTPTVETPRNTRQVVQAVKDNYSRKARVTHRVTKVRFLKMGPEKNRRHQYDVTEKNK